MLHALSRQAQAPSPLEVIVVDNGSTDDTPNVAAKFPGVKVVQEQKRGPAAARNRGLRTAVNDIIVHLDADTLPTRTWLSKIVAVFQDRRVVLAAGNTLIYAPSSPVERYIAGAGLYETERAISRAPFPFVPSLNMAVRREAALAIGGWSEELITAEDVDFCYRILKQFPSEIAYAKDAILFHRVRSTPEQLVRLAYTYGEGAARMYLRYRDELGWDALKTAKVYGWVLVRAATTAALSVARVLGLTSRERLEFSRYHHIWLFNFCKGFMHMYYGAEGRAA
ncbi:MAG: glycosyltransferase [Candidatus Eremiobacteraeota bacterium]|nr:glycosyltransferase [Candidatus Eremiobacteraeota bacterium]